VITQVSVCPESKLNACMWNVQTIGSFCVMGSGSPAPSWILIVPLFPGVAPAASGLVDAAELAENQARLTTRPRRATAAPKPFDIVLIIAPPSPAKRRILTERLP